MTEHSSLIGCTGASMLQRVGVRVRRLVKLLALRIEAAARHPEATVTLPVFYSVLVVVDLIVVRVIAS